MTKSNLVFQSFRTSSVPESIKVCQKSVKAWAIASGYTYHHLGDEFFDIVPTWYIERCDGEKLPITDLARLLWINKFLAKGWDRVIWIDADILIFDGSKVNFDVPYSYALNKEVWLWRVGKQQYIYRISFNNCAMMFEDSNGFLLYYISSCLRYAKNKIGKINRTDMGPKLLSNIMMIPKYPLIDGIGLLSPLVLWDLADENIVSLLIHSKLLGSDIGGANLCGSLSDKNVFHEHAIQDEIYLKAINSLYQFRDKKYYIDKLKFTAREVSCKEEADKLNEILMHRGNLCV